MVTKTEKRKPIYIFEMTVSLSREINQAMGMASEFVGMKPAQYARQAVVEKLIRDQMIEHPLQKYANAAAAAKATPNAA